MNTNLFLFFNIFVYNLIDKLKKDVDLETHLVDK